MDECHFFLLLLIIGIGSAAVHFKVSNNSISSPYKICIKDGLENKRCTLRNITLEGCLNVSMEIYWSDDVLARLVNGKDTLFAVKKHFWELSEYSKFYYTQNMIKPFIFEKVTHKGVVQMWLHLEENVVESTLNYPTVSNDEAMTSKLEVFCGQITDITIQIDQNKDINSLDSTQATALTWAVLFGDVETVLMLIKNGANVTQLLGPRKVSIVSVAARSGNEDVLNVLLEHGARADVVSADGASVMHSAVEGRNINIAKKLFSLYRESVNASQETRTPLHLAAELQEPAFVDFLVASGAHIMAKDFYERTALHVAAEVGGSPVVKALVAAGIPIDDKDIFGRTPLMLAAKAGKKENVQTLVDLGANVNAVDSENKSVSDYAKEYPGNQEILKKVLTLPNNPYNKTMPN